MHCKIHLRVRINLGTDTEPLPIHCGWDGADLVFIDRPQFRVISDGSMSSLVVYLNGDACVHAQHMSVRCVDNSYPIFDVSRRRFILQWQEGCGSGCDRCSEAGQAWEQTTSTTCRPTIDLQIVR